MSIFDAERPETFEPESEALDDVAEECESCGRSFLPVSNSLYGLCSTCHKYALELAAGT